MEDRDALAPQTASCGARNSRATSDSPATIRAQGTDAEQEGIPEQGRGEDLGMAALTTRCIIGPAIRPQQGVFQMRILTSIGLSLLLAFASNVSYAKGGHGGAHASHSSAASRSSSHAQHSNQGGHYSGGQGSSHKGGHYVNPRTGNHYSHHKP